MNHRVLLNIVPHFLTGKCFPCSTFHGHSSDVNDDGEKGRTCLLNLRAVSFHTEPLRPSQDPLCVGGSYVNNLVTPQQGTTNFFIGLLDEVSFTQNNTPRIRSVSFSCP